jgi:hypothetical protein
MSKVIRIYPTKNGAFAYGAKPHRPQEPNIAKPKVIPFTATGAYVVHPLPLAAKGWDFYSNELEFE